VPSPYILPQILAKEGTEAIIVRRIAAPVRVDRPLGERLPAELTKPIHVSGKG